MQKKFYVQTQCFLSTFRTPQANNTIMQVSKICEKSISIKGIYKTLISCPAWSKYITSMTTRNMKLNDVSNNLLLRNFL